MVMNIASAGIRVKTIVLKLAGPHNYVRWLSQGKQKSPHRFAREGFLFVMEILDQF
jgi:hypothetical protein